MNIKEITISMEEYEYLVLRDEQLEFALDMIPNLDDVLEQKFGDEE